MSIRALFLMAVLSISASFVRAEVVVFAAASLKEPLDRIAAEFGDVVVSYGGSGTLARQVGLGAPADVVLLANADWMTVLSEEGDVQEASVVDFASNRLVLIGPADAAAVALTEASMLSALGEGRIAVGFTKAVPAGIYAKAALQSLGLWRSLSARLAEVDNVRAALALVARGQAPLGIVYQSDVRVSGNVKELAVFPNETHPPIRYVGAVTTHAAGPEPAAFLDYLLGDAGQVAMADAGFLPPMEQRE
ncbi:molybdate ABC transporter substrate-binding protein [Loktanella sp. Alg231-35]|uniref:molybdate ABC transporter substrate-binding protein n=1 Tax=Loktanella sp. Alg231-35 TaxID=1922220 RepID=UPI000D5616E0|nr:molybdate ABC transporter substrate-binding protein [Loktanella sp. Alg231-35]